MSILAAVMMPHPPLIVPEVGRGGEQQIQQTTDACREAAAFVVGKQPETVVVISPHSVMYRDYLHISPGAGARGDLSRFGASQVRLEVRYDRELVRTLSLLAAQEGFPAGTEGERDAKLDHASFLPLYFLQQAAGGTLPFQVVRMGVSGLPGETHYQMGMLIKQAARQLGRGVCLVASGDLSHYLKHDGPYGYRSQGPEYDARLMDIMGRAAFDELLAMPEPLREKAGECGHNGFLVMAGALDGVQVEAKALSYQGVTGVGYGVALFSPGQKDVGRQFLNKEETTMEKASEPVRLARASYEHYICNDCHLDLPDNLPPWLLQRKAGVFVTLHKFGQLRGCIGTITPVHHTIAEEIIHNAVSAATADPRFSPVTEEELKDITCSVDILDEPEDISSQEQLDPSQYGVIVRSGVKRGLLLPMLEGVDTVDEQVDIARRKAGILPGEKVSLQRFKVTRYL